jgi:hypothetical protein
LDWLPSGEYFVVLANDKEYSESKKIIKQWIWRFLQDQLLIIKFRNAGYSKLRLT